jgi:hypothetical protein
MRARLAKQELLDEERIARQTNAGNGGGSNEHSPPSRAIIRYPKIFSTLSSVNIPHNPCSGIRPLPLSQTVSRHMPPVELARQSQYEPSHYMNAKVPHDHGSSFEAANPLSAFASRDKEFGAPGGFENIVNGRYSGIGRGGSVGDELVRPACNSSVVSLQGLKVFL